MLTSNDTQIGTDLANVCIDRHIHQLLTFDTQTKDKRYKCVHKYYTQVKPYTSLVLSAQSASEQQYPNHHIRLPGSGPVQSQGNLQELLISGLQTGILANMFINT